jgi:hypothetical protein
MDWIVLLPTHSSRTGFCATLKIKKAWEGQMTDDLNAADRRDYLDQPIDDLHKIHGPTMDWIVLLPTHSSRTGFCATLKMALAATSGSKTGVRELWVGSSTIQSIVGQFFFPGYLDRLMVKKAWDLRNLKDGAGGHFRLKDRRHRSHRPGELIPCPFELVGQFFFPGYLDRLMVKKAWEGQMTDDLNAADRRRHLARHTGGDGRSAVLRFVGKTTMDFVQVVNRLGAAALSSPSSGNSSFRATLTV